MMKRFETFKGIRRTLSIYGKWETTTHSHFWCLAYSRPYVSVQPQACHLGSDTPEIRLDEWKIEFRNKDCVNVHMQIYSAAQFSNRMNLW